MVISEQEFKHIAGLAGLALEPGQSARILASLNPLLALVEPLRNAASPQLEPLVYPLMQELRLRNDQAHPPASPAQRDALMANAPARAEGLFLVPTVLE